MRQEVAKSLRLREVAFAANAETGLQPLVLGYSIKQVPISWVSRSADMGVSSFNLARVGGGYGRVLIGLWLKYFFGIGPYRDLARPNQSSIALPTDIVSRQTGQH